MKQIFLTHRNEHREANKMRKQRNMPQMKQQEKTPENKLNEMEENNLPEAEFKLYSMNLGVEWMSRMSTSTER